MESDSKKGWHSINSPISDSIRKRGHKIMGEKEILKMRHDAKEIFMAGLEAVEPAKAIKRHCRLEGDRLKIGNKIYNLSGIRNIFVIGAGKAAASMSRALEDILGDRIKGGIINVKYGHLAELKKVIINEAGHPVPDEAGLNGTRQILELSQKADKDDLVLCVISGGGSALLPMPVQDVSLKEKQETTKILLECGATIHEINAIRKHISQIKGGRLARAVYPARLVSLILSDVIGDNLDVIASGPTVPDSSTFYDCLNILECYGIKERIPSSVLEYIQKGARGESPETPKVGDPAFESTYNLIIGNNLQCVLAAQEKAKSLGYNTLILSTMIEGETKEVAKVHAAIAKEIKKTDIPTKKPACILSGGETTVTIRGNGLGGRNQEFALAIGMELNGWDNIVVLSAGTDGTDGPTDAAGAIADGEMVKKAEEKGLSPLEYLLNNDSYHLFEKIGDLFKTGPTNTNVMDLRIILVKD